MKLLNQKYSFKINNSKLKFTINYFCNIIQKFFTKNKAPVNPKIEQNVGSSVFKK